MKVYELTLENTHIFYGYATENDTENRYNDLSQYRKSKVAKLKNINNKELSVLSEMLLLYGMDMLNIEHRKPLEIALNEYGKPYVNGMDDFYFNLSHSGDMAVCAISDVPVGVDVEKISRDCSSIIDRYYTDFEKEISKDKGTSYIWTRKEAVAKANGRGIGVGIDKIDTSGDYVVIDDEKYLIFTKSVDDYYISFSYKSVSP